MRDGDHLELGLGEGEPVTVSLRGATAVDADDRRPAVADRDGDGARAARRRAGGERGAAPDAPAVAALPIRALDPSPTLPEGVAAADDPGCEDVEAMAFDLGGGAMLWGACDFAGAYNTAYRFWVAGPDGVAPAAFDVPGRRDDDPAVLTGPASPTDGLGIEAMDARARRRRLRRGEPLGLDRRRLRAGPARRARRSAPGSRPRTGRRCGGRAERYIAVARASAT